MTDEKRSSRSVLQDFKGRVKTLFAFILATFFLSARVLGSSGSALFSIGKALNYLFKNNPPSLVLFLAEAITAVTNVTVNLVSRTGPIFAFFGLERIANTLGSIGPAKKARIAEFNHIAETTKPRREQYGHNTKAGNIRVFFGWNKNISPVKNLFSYFIKICMLISGLFTALGGFLGGQTQLQKADELLGKAGLSQIDFAKGAAHELGLGYSGSLGSGMFLLFGAYEYGRVRDDLEEFLGDGHQWHAKSVALAIALGLPFYISQPFLFFYNTEFALKIFCEVLWGTSEMLTPDLLFGLRCLSATTGFISMTASRFPSSYKFVEEKLKSNEAFFTVDNMKKLFESKDARTSAQTWFINVFMALSLIDAISGGFQGSAAVPNTCGQEPFNLDPYSGGMVFFFSVLVFSSAALTFLFNGRRTAMDAVRNLNTLSDYEENIATLRAQDKEVDAAPEAMESDKSVEIKEPGCLTPFLPSFRSNGYSPV